ncbi:radial spoke head protein 3 homolog [Orycteropus afer afer]|uniref:Radial spoke head protein 3 homolog n=1 Tax=Orycteropus afer afer TaxID=1230840 RepID=A0A8B7A7S7_ORYAF|nr:radial spoke head protein 3 homolog [Orycteropus afer afer]
MTKPTFSGRPEPSTTPASREGAAVAHRRPCGTVAAGRSQKPEVLRGGDRNCAQVPPAGRIRRCSATVVKTPGGLSAPWSEPNVTPTYYCLGYLPSRPPHFLPPLLGSRNPCPWHYFHYLSGSHDALAPTCLKAKLHRKRSGPKPDVAPALTDRSSPTMGTYTYTSQPRALPCQRRRYRDNLLQPDEEPVRFGNIMYDRRVIRGNTYALQTLPLAGQQDPLELQRQQQAKRRTLTRKRAQEQLRPRTPEPVEGRKHVDVQTELYLEEIADRIIEVDMECQTDAFLDRPPTPLFIPAKTGRDMATQILEGELFDFDLEVKPMLEVLVGKTIEQALLEVMEEEELANLQANQYAYEELRNVELAEVQRLEEQERRHREEKERRKQQQWEIVHKHNETAQKIAARAFAQRYLADLLPSVFGSLRDGGYFYDPIERDIETGFLPWLMNEVAKTMEHNMVGRAVLDMLIREVVEKRLDMYENKEDAHQPHRPMGGWDGSEAMQGSLGPYELHRPNSSPTQRPLVDRDYLSRAAYDRRYMEGGLYPDEKGVEEGDSSGQNSADTRMSLEKEELTWPPSAV